MASHSRSISQVPLSRFLQTADTSRTSRTRTHLTSTSDCSTSSTRGQSRGARAQRCRSSLPTANGDELIYAREVSTGLSRIPAAGGKPQVLTVLQQEQREKSHRFPQVLLGG